VHHRDEVGANPPLRLEFVSGKGGLKSDGFASSLQRRTKLQETCGSGGVCKSAMIHEAEIGVFKMESKDEDFSDCVCLGILCRNPGDEPYGVVACHDSPQQTGTQVAPPSRGFGEDD